MDFNSYAVSVYFAKGYPYNFFGVSVVAMATCLHLAESAMIRTFLRVDLQRSFLLCVFKIVPTGKLLSS